MIKIVDDRSTKTVAGTLVVAFSAAMATGQVHWPVREVPAYVVNQTAGTYSHFADTAVIIASKLPSDTFAREIAAVYAALSERQEPLGVDFEAVWDANVADLYEA